MGKEKYKSEIMEFFGKTPVVTSRDVRLIVDKVKIKRGYAHLLIHNLIKSGRIKKIAKGFYTAHDDPTVAVFSFRPAYIGLQDALSLRGLWEQETNVVIITARKVRPGVREIMDSNVILRRIKPSYFFGAEMLRYGDLFVPVSDLEKTLIDFIYFREPLEKEVLNALKRKIDRKKLESYLKIYPKKFRERVNRTLNW